MESIERKQFTCYRSYYDAIRRLPKKDRLAAYDLLMEYAFFGKGVEMEKMPPAVASMFIVLRPNLDAARKRAQTRLVKTNGKPVVEQCVTGGCNKSESECKSESKNESECESECKCKDEKDSYISAHTIDPRTPFGQFWQAYPRKDCMEAAQCEFEKIDVPLDVILQALEQVKQGQWKQENGRYIPKASVWLQRCPWALTQPAIGELELRAIREMMSSESF